MTRTNVRDYKNNRSVMRLFFMPVVDGRTKLTRAVIVSPGLNRSPITSKFSSTLGRLIHLIFSRKRIGDWLPRSMK